MKIFIAIASLLVFIPTLSHAVDSKTVVSALEKAESVDIAPKSKEISLAIRKILSANEFLARRFTETKILLLSNVIAKASYVTNVDWRYLLAISYVESRLCLYTKGDQKIGTTGRNLFDFWSVGCAQVNMRWWGKIISEAGLLQEDLLDYEKGIIVGGLILKYKADRFGWEEAIKRYNGTGKAAEEYRNKVLRIYRLIS